MNPFFLSNMGQKLGSYVNFFKKSTVSLSPRRFPLNCIFCGQGLSNKFWELKTFKHLDKKCHIMQKTAKRASETRFRLIFDPPGHQHV